MILIEVRKSCFGKKILPTSIDNNLIVCLVAISSRVPMSSHHIK